MKSKLSLHQKGEVGIFWSNDSAPTFRSQPTRYQWEHSGLHWWPCSTANHYSSVPQLREEQSSSRSFSNKYFTWEMKSATQKNATKTTTIKCLSPLHFPFLLPLDDLGIECPARVPHSHSDDHPKVSSLCYMASICLVLPFSLTI